MKVLFSQLLHFIRKFYLIILVGLALTISLMYYFQKHDETAQLYAAQIPIRKDVHQIIKATGTLQAKDQLTVGSLLAARIVGLHADENDVVKKGQLLATLDDGILDAPIKRLEAQLHAQQARVTYQKATFERQKRLYEQGHISDDAFELEIRDLHVAQEQFKQIAAEKLVEEQRYENLFIKAPDAGVIIARNVNLGQMVTAQLQATELFIIAKDLRKMEAYVDVDEADVGMVKPNQPVMFYVDAFPNQSFKAKVNYTEYHAKVADNVVTYGTIINVDNPDRILRPGMTVNVSIEVASSSNALCVPNKVFRINTKALEQIAADNNFSYEPVLEDKKIPRGLYVWIKEGSAFKEKHVKTGVRSRKFTEIISGIEEHDEVIIEAFRKDDDINPLLKQAFGSSPIGKK